MLKLRPKDFLWPAERWVSHHVHTVAGEQVSIDVHLCLLLLRPNVRQLCQTLVKELLRAESLAMLDKMISCNSDRNSSCRRCCSWKESSSSSEELPSEEPLEDPVEASPKRDSIPPRSSLEESRSELESESELSELPSSGGNMGSARSSYCLPSSLSYSSGRVRLLSLWWQDRSPLFTAKLVSPADSSSGMVAWVQELVFEKDTKLPLRLLAMLLDTAVAVVVWVLLTVPPLGRFRLTSLL